MERATDIDITKVYSESLNFLVQESQRLHGVSKSNEKDFDKIGMSESFMNERSSSPIGTGFEYEDFKNDVMFSSASMSESSTEGCSTSGNNSKITTKSTIYSGDGMVFSERFGQNFSTDLSVTDIKKEHISDDEEVVDTYFQANSQTVFPGMMTSSVKSERDLGICSPQSESSQDNVSFVIKQEPLTDDDDVNDNNIGHGVFGEFLLKGNDLNDTAGTSVIHQNEGNPNKRKTSEVDFGIGSTKKRAKRNSTGKLYKKFGSEFHMDKVDALDEDYNPNEGAETEASSEEEYIPSIYIDKKKKNKEVEKTEMDGKTPQNALFSFENLDGNTLNIKGTSKNLQVKIFKCPECHDIFTYESVLKKHMRKHSGDLPFKCKHCNLGFMTQFSHDLHSRVHTSDKLYTCGVCGEKIKLKKDLKEHNTNHVLTKKAQEISANRPVKIEPTGTATGGNENLSEVGLSPFGCSMCVFVAKDFAEIGNHVMESHFVDKRCFCDICSRRFANTDDLKLHKGLHEGQYEEISCGICEEIVDSKEDLMKHLDIHPEAKPYKCCYCGDKFIVLPQLQNHMQTHSFTKRYNCPHCLKQFFHEDTLESHLRVHTGEISYTCPVCEKGFRTSDRLRIHMRQHPVPYSLFSNYENKSIDSTGDASNSQKEELLHKDKFVEEDRGDFQESDVDYTNTVESGTPELKTEPGCNVDVSGSNSYPELTLRLNKKIEGCEYESDSGKPAETVTIKQEAEASDEEGQLSGGMDSSYTEDVYRPSGEVANSSSGSIFEKLRKQRSLDGSQIPTSGANNTGTPFCISVKKLTKVAISDKPDDKCTSIKQTNSSVRFAEMENTMKLQMNIHQCNVCGAMFAYNNMLKKHMKKHTGEEPYKCDTCGHGCMSSSALKAHSMVHSGERPYVCNTCPKAFRQKSGLKAHLLTHDTINIFACKLCKKTFNHASLLQQHRQHSCEPDAVGCSICNITFKTMSSILTHVNCVHFKGKALVCDICSRRFDSTQSLQEHQAAHVDSQKYTCGICDQEYTDEDELQTHLNDHPTAKPFKCQICSEQYSSVTPFCTHIESHLSEGSVTKPNPVKTSGKQYKCKYCDLVFPSGVQRWAHSAIHDKARPYSCSVCGKKYINKGSLARHEESHELANEKRCSGEILGKMKELVEQNSLKNTNLEGQVKKKRTPRQKNNQLKEKGSKGSSDFTKRNEELFDLKEKSGTIDDVTVAPDALNETVGDESSAREEFNNECSFIKTEPISTGYCDTETENDDVNLSLSALGSSAGKGLRTDENTSLNAGTLSYQVEIKTEQNADVHEDTQHTYACTTCGKTYMDRGNLEIHEKSHSTEVSEPVELMCTECGADFWRKSDLNKHIRKHHNETTKPSFKSKLKKVKMKDSAFHNS